MICNNCFSEIADGENICPHCKKRVSKKRFQINIPEEKLAQEFPEQPAFEAEDEPKQEEQSPAPQVDAAESTEASLEPPKKPEIKLEELPKPQEQKFKPAPEPVSPSSAPQQPQTQKVNPKQVKKEKTARAVLLSICSLCAVAMIALTFVSKFTDVFQSTSDVVKTVALSGFTHSEKSSFENYAGFFGAFFESGFDRDEMKQDQLLSMMKPESAGGLYATFFKTAQVITDTPDPAERFGSEENGYSYCKVKKANIKKIMNALGQNVVNCANNGDCYYYDGFYYFAASGENDEKKTTYSVEVTSSKRTEDGNYYVECTFGDKDKKERTLYCIASLEKGDEGEKWSLIELSNSELFTADGLKIEKNENEALKFTMQRKTITGKTKGGVLFANYIIEYPVFSAAADNENAVRAATTLNTLYNELLSKYETKAKRATALYKRYLQLGGKKSDLPAYAYVSSTVTYNKDGVISLLEQTHEYLPRKEWFENKKALAAEKGEELKPAVLMPTTTYEGYALDIESGEFLKKDSVLGKDYYATQQKLFELYLEKHGLLPEDEAAAVPEDTNNIGQLLSSSAWSLCEDGVLFSYIDPEGYNDSLVLPYSMIN